jgi:ATP-dependent Lon protease
MPKTDEKDLEEVPGYLKKEMVFVFVEHIQQIFDLILLS